MLLSLLVGYIDKGTGYENETPLKNICKNFITLMQYLLWANNTIMPSDCHIIS